MQRVVVFMGGPRDATSAVQRALPDRLRALSRAGVMVPESGRRRSFEVQGLSHQPLTNTASAGWAKLATEAAATKARTAFLVIPGMLRAGASPTSRSALIQRLTAIAPDVCLVSIVADQLTLVNEFYLNQVATWRLSKRLSGAAARLLENDIFAHERVLLPWLAERAVRYAAVPATDLTDGGRHPLAAVLAAAGVEDVDDLAGTAKATPPKLGPVGIEANRLLSTYLRAVVKGFSPEDERVIVESRLALARADKLGWCRVPFWGWTPDTARRAVRRFEESNQRFARAVWDTDWPLPYPVDRPGNQVDVLELEAGTVEQVQRFVFGVADRLSKEPAGTG